ncbi:DUF397 domain-containing protein [Actinacidiphila oryziradicis]|uniref:DUF397 domain-containing protein n=1 Tax=Actinacidiphila oryziradicis TaxID=2571141 RepID=A0A4U0SPS3_9ACTN|nr:DUF397 domain-containing protein [Actinacidiphila oryziradicis]TKA10227.1 DUF397 domain-containing protein [Actinacidiphila oryziradicis]
MSEINWQKSSYSGQGDGAECIELAAAGTIRLRESDDPGVIVTTTPAPLKALLLGIKASEFDGDASPVTTAPQPPPITQP